MLWKDRNNGMELLKAKLPETFQTDAYVNIEQYPSNRIIKVYAKAYKEGCTIYYQTGESYLFNKGGNGFFNNTNGSLGQQNESGAYYDQFSDIISALDRTASSLLKKQVKGSKYYDLSETTVRKAQQEFQKQISQLVEELQLGATASMIPIANVFRNYLLDGGMGVYEDEGKTMALCFYRIGAEVDFVQGQGISEKLGSYPFTQAPLPMMGISSASWNIPFYTYMISDSIDDLKLFMNYVDSLEMAEQLQAFMEQNRQEVMQYQYQKAQMETMRNQQMWSNAFAQQQQAWAASDRLRDSIHQDLDRFHNNLHQQMAQNDMRFNLGANSFGQESSDDRIQRWRHESMMGVETYERSDGTEVEFDHRADRVFENDLDSTDHFGTRNYYDDFIPDGWHELNKK